MHSNRRKICETLMSTSPRHPVQKTLEHTRLQRNKIHAKTDGGRMVSLPMKAAPHSIALGADDVEISNIMMLRTVPLERRFEERACVDLVESETWYWLCVLQQSTVRAVRQRFPCFWINTTRAITIGLSQPSLSSTVSSRHVCSSIAPLQPYHPPSRTPRRVH
jgi:hypothetical protein